MRGAYIFSIILLLLSPAFAQQISIADNALLLDYYQNQRFEEASIYLKKIYPEPVTDIRALGQLAYTANMAGKTADAEGYYQRLYDMDSTRTDVLFSLGSINLRRGNNTKAEHYYKEIAARDTDNFMVYKQLAQINNDKNDLGSYVIYLQKANRLNPAEPDVASALSDQYIQVRLTGQAEKVLNAAITADPENITLLESLMKLTYAQEKWPETIDACLKLIKSGNRSGLVMGKLLAAYYNTKNYICGAETFADMNTQGQTEFTYYYAAMCYKALKDQKHAIFLLNKAIDDGISPAISSYYGEIAGSNEALGKYKKAALAYRKALQFTESILIYYSLASLYDTNLKDKKNALKYYRKYLASKPPAAQRPYAEYSKTRIVTLSR